MIDRDRWNARYRDGVSPARVNPDLIRYASLLKPGRVLDVAGGLGQNGAWLAALSTAFRVVNADVSDQALVRAPKEIACVVADAGALPFKPNSFDTILNLRFFDPRLTFSEWLTSGGTIFFETYATGDEKYRPDFNPAHRFDPAFLSQIFAGLEIIVQEESDNGSRVYVTIIARKTSP